MTDFGRLSDLPELPPEPGQADAALRMVHRRRRRSALRTVSAAGVAALAATFVTSLGPGTSTLHQTDEGVTQTATAVPSPTGHGGETKGATGPRLATGQTGGSAPVLGPVATASPTDDDGAPVTAHPSSRAPRAEDPPPRPRQPVRRTIRNGVADRLEGPSPCTPGPSVSGGWCGGALPEYQNDGTILFRVSICSSSDNFRIAFPAEQEVDAVVRTRDNDEVWRWGRGQKFDAWPHDIVLNMQECVNWRIPWDYVRDDGARLPPGRYLAELPIFSKDVTGFATWFNVE